MRFNSHLHLDISAHSQLQKFREGIYSLYIAHTIKGFVSSLIGFFIPIFLYKIGFTLSQILLFYAFKEFFIMLFSVMAGGIGNKLGLRHTMMISLPLFLAYLIGTAILKYHPSLLYLYTLSIISAFASALYWVPMHALFTRFSSGKNSTSQVGTLMSLKSISSMVAPLLGGIISLTFGFESLFILASVILVVPIIILLNSKDVHPHINFSLKDLQVFFTKHRQHFLSIILDSFGSFAETILWPLFVFLILNDAMAVGIVGSLIGVGTVIFALLLSKVIARHNYLLVMKLASFMLATTWVIKYFANKQISIFAISLIASLFAIMFSIPLASHTYKIAKDSKNIDEFIVFKQILSHGGILLAVLTSLLLVLHLNFSFLITGASYILITLL